MAGKHAHKGIARVAFASASTVPAVAGERRAALMQERNSTPSDATKPVRARGAGSNPTRKKLRKSRRNTGLLTILAELLITIGIISALFLLWKFVINDYFTDMNQAAEADTLIQEFGAQSDIDSLEYDPQNPPVLDPSDLANGEKFAVLYIPRLDANYKRIIAHGTSLDVLANGAGHYTSSQMPGEVGNFAVAGHRSSVLNGLKNLVPGDRVYVQTSQGYYIYEMKEDSYVVKPDAIEVIAPVPNQPGTEATERIITLTTCYPEWSNTERLIAHAEFVEWRPLDAGPPAEIQHVAG